MGEEKDYIVGVGKISLHFRHARSLKDKRQILKGILHRLRQEGFSVTECGYGDNPKRAVVGVAYAGHSHSHVEQQMERALGAFVGDMEVLQRDRDVFDYAFEKEEGWLSDKLLDWE